MMEPFPKKPRGMHWSTYWRLFDRHEESYLKYVRALSPWS